MWGFFCHVHLKTKLGDSKSSSDGIFMKGANYRSIKSLYFFSTDVLLTKLSLLSRELSVAGK